MDGAVFVSIIFWPILVLFHLYPFLSEIWFSFLFSFFVKIVDLKNMPCRKPLFSSISSLVSKDPKLVKENTIRILEIGSGPGSNFHHYPKNARIIALDKNHHFRDYYIENQGKFPGLVLEEFIHGMAEDMRDVPDESVDAVVATHVLCSVTDPEAVLREVKRVLVKGGHFYTFEHGPYSEETPIKRWIQFKFNFIWKILMAGCTTIREAKYFVEKAGFSSFDLKYAEIQTVPFFVTPNVYGLAVK
jgi:SAM-dependent methyltransferase